MQIAVNTQYRCNQEHQCNTAAASSVTEKHCRNNQYHPWSIMMTLRNRWLHLIRLICRNHQTTPIVFGMVYPIQVRRLSEYHQIMHMSHEEEMSEVNPSRYRVTQNIILTPRTQNVEMRVVISRCASNKTRRPDALSLLLWQDVQNTLPLGSFHFPRQHTPASMLWSQPDIRPQGECSHQSRLPSSPKHAASCNQILPRPPPAGKSSESEKSQEEKRFHGAY